MDAEVPWFRRRPFRDGAIRIIGSGRLLLGGDWPFPMGAPTADHDLVGLNPDQRRRIRKENCEGAFGFRLIEVYGGPHHPETPSWYTGEQDAG